MIEVKGKIALVTGASRGIGRATALALANAGARVLVHYSTGRSEAETVAADIVRSGGHAETVGMDLSLADGPHRLACKVGKLVDDRLDILVANAGVGKSAALEDLTVADFDRLFAVNVRAPYFLVQQLLPFFVEGSSIVFTSSLAAHTCVGALSAYASTKGAIDTLVKYFAAALGEHGIRVNAVAPGIVATEMSNFTKTDVGRNYAMSIQSMKRLAQPDDIADAIVYLSSDAARWITGDTLRVDGGSKL